MIFASSKHRAATFALSLTCVLSMTLILSITFVLSLSKDRPVRLLRLRSPVWASMFLTLMCLLFLLGAPATASAAAPFSDSFETSTPGTLPPGYLLLDGAAEILRTTQKDGASGNVLKLIGRSAAIEVVAAGTQSDFRLEFYFQGISGRSHSVQFRAHDLDNGFRLHYDHGVIAVGRLVRGVETTIVESLITEPFPHSSWVRVTVEAVGNEARITDNNSLFIMLTDDTYE